MSVKSSSPVFPYLSRRGFLIAGAMSCSALKALPSEPSCSLAAEQEEGPYYVDDEVLRRDITEGKRGVNLQLAIRLVDSRTCAPLRNSAIDIWHCDATGVYSGFTSNSPNGGPGGMPPDGHAPPGGMPPGGPPPDFDPRGFGPRGPRKIDATRFLRGVQITDNLGAAEFATLYPGWYFGRAVHIHMKVHLGGAAATKYSGGHVAHTGQLFFPEDLTERVARVEPYAQRLTVHRTTQKEDGIFSSQNGSRGMLTMERLGKTDQDGFRGVITLAIDPEATPAPVRGFGGRGPGGPPPRG